MGQGPSLYPKFGECSLNKVFNRLLKVGHTQCDAYLYMSVCVCMCVRKKNTSVQRKSGIE